MDIGYRDESSSHTNGGSGQFFPLLYLEPDIKIETDIDHGTETYFEPDPLHISVWRDKGVTFDDNEPSQECNSENMVSVNFRHVSTQTDERNW